MLKRWLNSGAPWSKPDAAMQSATPESGGAESIGDAWSDSRNPIVRIFGGERLDLWSLKPITQPATPDTLDGTWSKNVIDQFRGRPVCS